MRSVLQGAACDNNTLKNYEKALRRIIFVGVRRIQSLSGEFLLYLLQTTSFSDNHRGANSILKARLLEALLTRYIFL
jgi:hypothetical protein